MTMVATLVCPKCLSRLPIEEAETVPRHRASRRTCPGCRTDLSAWVFPAVHGERSKPGSEPGGTRSSEGDAVCHFYPELKADTVCEECGCFLSERAAVAWGGQTYCLPCLHQLREKKGADHFVARRTLYDNTALALVTLLAPLSLFTAPLALYYLLRYRKASRGVVPRSSFRWWLAMFLTLGWLGLWGFLFVAWVMVIVEGMTTA